jgi:hypothetical protein
MIETLEHIPIAPPKFLGRVEHVHKVLSVRCLRGRNKY